MLIKLDCGSDGAVPRPVWRVLKFTICSLVKPFKASTHIVLERYSRRLERTGGSNARPIEIPRFPLLLMKAAGTGTA